MTDIASDPAFKFLPGARLHAGEKAAENRAQLGPSITMTSSFRAGWSTIKNNRGEESAGRFESKNGKLFEVVVTAKPSSEYQKSLTRDVTAFSADPYHRGTIGRDGIRDLLYDAYFETKLRTYSEKSKKWVNIPIEKAEWAKKDINTAINNWHKQGRIGQIDDINSALYSRNYAEGRKFTLQEIRSKLNQGDWISNERNTFMPKIAETLRDYNAEVSVFNRLNPETMTEVYNFHNLLTRNPKYKALKDSMFRTYFETPHTDFMKYVMENELWRTDASGKHWNLDLLMQNSSIKEISDAYKKYMPKFMQEKEGVRKNWDKQKYMEEWQKSFGTLEEFISQDLDDMATFDRILAIGGDKMNPKLVSAITKHVDLIKVANYLNYRKYNTKINPDSYTQEMSEVINRLNETILGKKDSKYKNMLMDQNTLDREIKRFKHKLPNAKAKELYDTLLIGSFRTADTIKNLPKLLKQRGETKEKWIFDNAVKEILTDGSKTSSTQLAYNSKVVSPINIQKFIMAKDKYFRKMTEKVQDAETKEMEKFDKESDKLDVSFAEKSSGKMAKRVITNYVGDYIGYDGLKPGILNSKQSKVVSELTNYLKQEPDFVGKDLNQVLAGIHYNITGTPKNINQMNIQDLATINRWFKHIKSGNWLQKLQTALKGRMKKGISGFDYMEFPESVSRKMMAHDIKFMPKQGFFLENPGNLTLTERKMLVPTQYGEILTKYIGRFQSSADNLSRKLLEDFDADFRFLKTIETETDFADRIWRLSVRLHEKKGRNHDLYEQLWEQSKVNNDWADIKNRNFPVSQPDGTKKVMTGSQIVTRTIKALEKFTGKMHEKITGKLDENGNNIGLKKYQIGWFSKKDKQPRLDTKLFIKDIETMRSKGATEFMHDLGIDGVRHMTRSLMYDILPTIKYVNKNTKKSITIQQYNGLPLSKKKFFTPDKGPEGKKLEKLLITNTGKQKGYYPHIFFKVAEIKKAQKKAVEDLNNRTDLNSKERKAEQRKIMLKYKTLLGDWDFADYEMWKQQDALLFNATTKELGLKQQMQDQDIDLDQPNKRFGNMLSRTEDMPGWDVGPGAMESYLHKLSHTFYRQMTNMMSRVIINNMNKNNYKKWVKNKDDAEGKELVQNWSNFWTLYAREAVGNPVVVPDALYNNPSMRLDATPYGWWADNRIARLTNSIAKKLGIGSKLPEGMEPVDAHTIKRWSNVEGQYQLATLMTHPKTPINNIFGGTMHTWMSVGTETMKKIRNYEYLQQINPDLKTRKDVLDFVGSLGVTPEQTMYQWGMEASIRGNAKAKNFMRDLIKGMKSEQPIDRATIRETAKKYQLGGKFMDIASKFMSVPEQMLRTDAWIAHYIKAYERFGGAITNPRHPILIEMANKGVKLTQFLYNAPYRPAFARTGLGKTMTRFMLWSYNSVRFRNEVFAKAKIYGFRPGTESFNRLRRTMAADMMSYALSGAFMYSLFNNILPAPWSWLQDTSEWALGDEKERDRAFFGQWPGAVAPLQIITPPSARIPMSIIREFADDDYTKLSDYYIYTMFPFGRMVRDIVPWRENSIINNPARIPETLFGMPLRSASRKRAEIKKSEEPDPPRLGR